MNAIPVTDGKYEVVCYNCRGTFDALQSVRCSCLTSDPSLVCSCCLQCFCKAPQDYKIRFWEGAPRELWKRKNSEDKEPFVNTDPEPESSVRPLVLVVDDELLIQRTAVQAIQKLGYGTVVARNGIEGLAMAKKYRPNVILSDMLMPKMDGVQMCRFLKSDPDMLKIKVVMMTSLYTKAKHKQEMFREFRPDEYLCKPLNFVQLGTVLKKFLDRND